MFGDEVEVPTAVGTPSGNTLQFCNTLCRFNKPAAVPAELLRFRQFQDVADPRPSVCGYRGARDAAVRSIGRTFFVRELSFMLYASAFVVFPGGFGNPR